MNNFKENLVLDLHEQFKINKNLDLLRAMEEIKLGKHDDKIADFSDNVLSTTEASDLLVALANIERKKNE